jgi:hypothetical protein
MWCSQWEWKLNVADQHDVLIAAHFFESARQGLDRVIVIATKQVAIGLGDAFGRIEQAFAVGIISRPGNQGLSPQPRPHRA